ncbi:alpha/beta fold hydrolase [Spirosoma foliorum]|uniref:Alpha/beta hydrolase n=1 Tax=Spirosoma foliorum TaxID=2710596 RepID=A0A7G5GUE9_9BACT|nr:alpha/beta hydrolase [Spirosoma foliorum]QMW02491.1 alpha/beta hydrolase [Spirosoma foliorum]
MILYSRLLGDLRKASLLAGLLLGLSSVQAQSLYSKAIGNPQGEPLLFIHGGPGSSSALFEATTARPLAARGFYVIWYDRRGEGRSVDSAARYSFRQTMDDLDGIYKKYRLNTCNLIAFSFGGIVATLYAQQHPDRVRALVLTSALLSLPETYQTILDRSRTIYQVNGDRTSLAALDNLGSLDRRSYAFRSACFKEASKNGFFTTSHPNGLAQVLYARSQKDTLLTRLPTDTTNRASRMFWEHEHYSTLSILPLVQQLRRKGIHLYGIYGKDDGLYSRAQLRQLRHLIGTQHLLYLDCAAHYLYIDQQRIFSRALTHWLCKAPRTTR